MIGTFEWMELQSLSADITEARRRLAEARTNGDQRLIRILEQEIATAEQRRSEIVVQLSSHLADNSEKAAGSPAAEGATEETDVEPASAADDIAALLNRAHEGDGGAEADRGTASPIEREAAMALAADAVVLEAQPVDGLDSPADIAVMASDDASEPQDQGDAEESRTEIVDRATVVTAAQPEATGQSNIARGEDMAWDQLTPEDLERAKEELVTRRTEMLARHAEELSALDADRDQLAVLEQAIASFVRKFTAPSGDGSVVNLGDERERLIGNG